MALTVNSKKKETTEIVKYNKDIAVIRALDAKYKDFVLDPDNPDSKALLMTGLRKYRQHRLEVIEWYKKGKAYILEAGRRYDKEKNDWLDIISPGENRLKAIRKAEDDRLATIEKARVDDIRAMINNIRNLDYSLPELNLKEMQSLKKKVESTPILEEDYQEFVGEAMACVHNVLIAINNAIEQRERFDREEAKRKAEDERLEKIRKEQDEARVKIDEANRKVEEARAEAEAELKAAQAKIDEANRKTKEAQDKIDAQMAEIQVQKDRLEAAKRAGENRKKQEEFERQAKIKAEQEAKEKAEKEKQAERERLETEEAEKKRQAALMPDKDKMLGFCDMLDAITPPRCKDEKCNVILNFAMKEIYGISSKIREEMEEL